jgi:uncharacterized SAM-binding protein YcdF (DUF218 family)
VHCTRSRSGIGAGCCERLIDAYFRTYGTRSLAKSGLMHRGRFEQGAIGRQRPVIKCPMCCDPRGISIWVRWHLSAVEGVLMQYLNTKIPLFILGSPNTASGDLSPISISRINRAIELQRIHGDFIIMATGGFGDHFNTSSDPHRDIVHRYLAASGVSFDAAEPSDLLSSNTVEDVLLIKAFAKQRQLKSYGVVTSQFHMRRCQYIFNCLSPEDEIAFFAANDPANLETTVIEHETNALSRMIEQGGVQVAGVIFPRRDRI